MAIIKKYWYVILLLLGTLGLGIATVYISIQLQNRSSITTDNSRAASPACTLTFTILQDSPTTTPPPTNTPLPTNSPTPVPASCNQTCNSVADCSSGLTCYQGFCRAPSCVTQSSCVCPSPTPTNTPVPSNTPNPTNTPVPSSTPRPTNTPVPTATNTPQPTNTPGGPTNTPAPVVIGDYVWNDTNHNGVQDNNETGIPGVTVYLYNTQGQLVSTTTTDANGHYTFTVPAGSYYVQVTAPSGFTFCPQYQGGNSSTDSNTSPSTGRTDNITLTAGQSDLTIDSCLYPTVTNTPVIGQCNTTCSTNANCNSSYICSNGYCRNPQCTEQPNCSCYFVPTPKVPVTGTGTTLMGIGVIAGGIILLILGIAF